jgi:hypothetical protein
MTLVNALLGVGFAILVFGLLLLGDKGDFVQGIIVSICLFFTGLAGLPIIINREVNIFIVSLHEFPAIVFGGVLLLSGFLGSAIFFISALRILLK